MVCIPCIVIPLLLIIWHKFLQPIFLRIWNPWGAVNPAPEESDDDDEDESEATSDSSKTSKKEHVHELKNEQKHTKVE